MTLPFGLYSRYYNLLYQDKDYVGESQYLHRLIKEYCADASEVLELGCGTGIHANLLSEFGLRVTGVERSTEMIQQRTTDNARVNIVQGDARTIRLGRKFDVVLALFHVVSYQQTDTDVADMFATVAEHLTEGGIFVFDVWYGPAVLDQQPERRVKTMEDEQTKVVRVAEPKNDFARNIVDVRYKITVTDKVSEQTETFCENHGMRYFFANEIEAFAAAAKMEVLHAEQWLDGRRPSKDSWGVAFVLKASNGESVC